MHWFLYPIGFAIGFFVIAPMLFGEDTKPQIDIELYCPSGIADVQYTIDTTKIYCDNGDRFSVKKGK